MRNRDIQTIEENVRALQDLKEEFADAIVKFQNDIAAIEKDLDRQFSVSHIITNIKNSLQEADEDEIFEFLSDIEAEASTLYYKYKRAEKASEVASYKRVINPATYNPRDF
jgi:CRISPR/Cas system-associated endonuclease Cas1